MKIFLVVILCFLCNSKSDMILWSSDKKITWSDFLGDAPKERGNKLAVTSSKISIKADFYKGDIPKYVIKSYFIKNESWSITKSKNHLSHERLHFDITELYSRKIRRELQKLVENEEKDVNCYKTVYRRYLSEYEEVQKKYDNEVYFNKVKQQEWIDNIHKELEELKEYEYILEE